MCWLQNNFIVNDKVEDILLYLSWHFTFLKWDKESIANSIPTSFFIQNVEFRI